MSTAMMERKAGLEPVIVPAEGTQSVSVFGVEADFLLSSQDTGGVFSVYRLTTEPGAGSPFHVHLEDDEAFYVLEGEFEVLVGEQAVRAGVGTCVYLPRRIPHAFRNVGAGTGRLLGIGTPAGHEQFFADASRLSMPPDPEEAMAVCRKYGMELLPPAKS